MRWLLLFLLIAFLGLQFSEGGFFDNLDDWEDGEAFLEDNPPSDDEGDYDDDDFGRKGIISTLKTFKVKKKCGCQETVCGCCTFTLLNDEATLTACFNMTNIEGEKKVEASLVLNGKKVFTKKIGEKKKCAKIPYTASLARVCLVVYNISSDPTGLHACVKLTLKLLTKQLITIDFNCLKLAHKKLSIDKPSGKPNSGIINFDVSKVDVDKLKKQVKKFKGFFKNNFNKFINLFKKDKTKAKPK